MHLKELSKVVFIAVLLFNTLYADNYPNFKNDLVPVDTVPCGIQCLYALCKMHDIPVDINQLATNSIGTNITTVGTSMLELKKIAENMGFICHGYKEDKLEGLKNLPLPAIVHLKQSHYQLVISIDDNNVRVIDVPAKLYDVPIAKFLNEWSGYVLTCVLPAKQCDKISTNDYGDSIYIEEPYWNMGQHLSGEVIKYSYYLINASKELVHVDSINSSCGCTVVGFNSHEILPMSKVEIPISIKTKGRKGEIGGHVFIKTDNNKYPLLKMDFEGEIFDLDSDLKISPKRIELGDIIQGETVVRKITVVRDEDKSIEYLKYICGIEGINVELSDSKNKNNSLELNVSFKPLLPLGPFEGNLVVVTNHEIYSEIIIPVRGNVIGDIKPYPSSVYVQFNKEKTITKSIQIKNLLGMPFNISRIEVVPQTLSIDCTYEQKSDFIWLVNVEVNDEKNENIKQGTIKVITDHNESIITIPITILK